MLFNIKWKHIRNLDGIETNAVYKKRDLMFKLVV